MTCRLAAGFCLIGLALAPAAHADWNAANDEANRQRMMNDMRATARDNDRRNTDALNRSTGYSYGNSGTSGRGTSGGSSDSGYSYQPYTYKPAGPRSIVATYEFTVFVKETEAQTIARLQSEARAGNAQSQYNLGRIYYTGYGGVAVDLNQARQWFCQAAGSDHPPAASQCAAMMYNGQGGPADMVAALVMMHDAAVKDEAYGQALYGFFTIAEANARRDASPQPEAIAFLEKAAGKGQAIAQGTLGSIVYFYGSFGATQDVSRAIGYLRQCSAQKLGLCMSMMGMMMLNGQNGVAKDLPEGVRLLKAAATGGDAGAAGALAMVMCGDAFGMRDDKAAFAYARQAAMGGDVQGQVLLAKLYYFGQGTSRDLIEAARWFKAAAAQGDAESTEALKEADVAEAAKSI